MQRVKVNHQKKYRARQAGKGLVRFELQLPQQLKIKFDELVAAVADELPTPFSKRQRLAKARIQVFEEITKDIRHEFFHLKDQIKGLKLEIEALSPTLFKLNTNSNAPIPHAISALPDDPSQLKQLLANFYVEAKTEARKAREYKRLSKQHEELYDAANLYNEKLQAKLKSESLPEEHKLPRCTA